MIIDGWLNWGTKILPPLRPDKRYDEENSGLGVVWHSQEGYGVQAMINIMAGPRETSFMFWVSKEGKLVQFAPVTASVWCSGNKMANTNYWPVELEGKAREPITDAQMECCLRLIAEWEEYSGDWAERGRTMWEHREVATRWSPNAGPTACPSGRYDLLWEALAGMTEAEVRRIVREELERAGLVKEGVPSYTRYYEAMTKRLSAASDAWNLEKVPGE